MEIFNKPDIDDLVDDATRAIGRFLYRPVVSVRLYEKMAENVIAVNKRWRDWCDGLDKDYAKLLSEHEKLAADHQKVSAELAACNAKLDIALVTLQEYQAWVNRRPSIPEQCEV